MRNHHPNDRKLDRFIHRNLAEEDDRRILLHVRNCSACKREIEARLTLSEQLRELAVAEPSPDFTDRVVQAAFDERGRARAYPQSAVIRYVEPPALWRRMLGPDTINIGVALAATYVFVTVGLFRGLPVLDASVTGDGIDRLIQVVRDATSFLHP